MMPAAPSRVTGVEEMIRQEGPSGNCSLPVVSVSSMTVPSIAAVHLPSTRRVPVTGAVGQPAPTSERSRLPLTVRHDELTVQAPTTLPPQALTSEHEVPAPPVPALAPPEGVLTTVTGLHPQPNVPPVGAAPPEE